jgi:hypothetical protein
MNPENLKDLTGLLEVPRRHEHQAERNLGGGQAFAKIFRPFLQLRLIKRSGPVRCD